MDSSPEAPDPGFAGAVQTGWGSCAHLRNCAQSVRVWLENNQVGWKVAKLGIFLKILFIYFYRCEEREKERERNIYV